LGRPYLVDRAGRIRFHHFGEGNSEETERAIQQLLGIDEETVRVEADGLAEAADWETLWTGETYVGYGRGGGRVASPAQLALNQWALFGDWTVEEEYALLRSAGGSITFRFRARDLNLVLVPPASGSPVRFTVLLTVSRPVTTTVSIGSPAARDS
jgi:Thioredoxin like C-terminal domain